MTLRMGARLLEMPRMAEELVMTPREAEEELVMTPRVAEEELL